LFEMVLVHAVEHRFSIRQVLCFGTALVGISYLILNVNFGVVWLYFAIFLLSTGEMLTLPFMSTVSINRSTPETQGDYMGFNSLAFAAASIFSPYLGTYTVERFGYPTLWTITGAILICTSLGF